MGVNLDKICWLLRKINENFLLLYHPEREGKKLFLMALRDVFRKISANWLWLLSVKLWCRNNLIAFTRGYEDYLKIHLALRIYVLGWFFVTFEFLEWFTINQGFVVVVIWIQHLDDRSLMYLLIRIRKSSTLWSSSSARLRG